MQGVVKSVSLSVSGTLSMLGLLPGLRPSFDEVTGEVYRCFIAARDEALWRTPSDRAVLYAQEEPNQGPNERLYTVSESGDLCALFTIECHGERVSLVEVESIPGNKLQGYVYPLALAFSHQLGMKSGCKVLTIDPPYLSPVVNIVSDQFCDRGDYMNGHSKVINPNGVTPWHLLFC